MVYLLKWISLTKPKTYINHTLLALPAGITLTLSLPAYELNQWRHASRKVKLIDMIKKR